MFLVSIFIFFSWLCLNFNIIALLLCIGIIILILFLIIYFVLLIYLYTVWLYHKLLVWFISFSSWVNFFSICIYNFSIWILQNLFESLIFFHLLNYFGSPLDINILLRNHQDSKKRRNKEKRLNVKCKSPPHILKQRST